MAMTADSSQTAAADTISSPQKQKPLPWAQIVRGEPESMASSLQPLPPPPQLLPEQSTFSDCSSPSKAAAAAAPQPETFETVETNNDISNAGDTSKKASPWKKPSPNGLAAAEVINPVMGAVSWPALSESTNKASPKSSAPSDLKVIPDGPSSPVPNCQGPVIPKSPQRQVNSNAKSNVVPARQRSMKRGGGGGGGASGSNSSSGAVHSQTNFTHPPQQPPSPPPYPIFAMSPNGYGNLVQVIPDQSARGNNWEPRPIVGGMVPQPPVMNDHRHPSRRGNFGPRGDGHYHNNFGGRRGDQDRGHYGNGRDVPAQSQRSPRGGLGRMPSQNSAPFVPPQPVRPFGNPLGFHDFMYIPVPLESVRGMPFIAPAPVPALSPLPDMVVRQIEYYFSDANLITDNYLKSKMDDQGWVPISLVAGFNQIRKMTNDIHLILYSLGTSTLLEVQDDKLRRRNDWMKWIPSSSNHSTDSGQQSFNANDLPTNSLQKMTMEEVAANGNTIQSSPKVEDSPESSSDQLMSRLQISQGENIDNGRSS
ncbi:la-related protein 1C-like [Mercurialis annua]|uniref:la-related protein 1C-like n=1 Tax=Mercurialis annua TaxID=3986 RepID=UPI00215F3897|nr:la-related protein 1C-like [Mercurialis annua]